MPQIWFFFYYPAQKNSLDPTKAQKNVGLTFPVPTIAQGLNALDIGEGTNQRIRSYVDGFKPADFQVYVETLK